MVLPPTSIMRIKPDFPRGMIKQGPRMKKERHRNTGMYKSKEDRDNTESNNLNEREGERARVTNCPLHKTESNISNQEARQRKQDIQKKNRDNKTHSLLKNDSDSKPHIVLKKDRDSETHSLHEKDRESDSEGHKREEDGGGSETPAQASTRFGTRQDGRMGPAVVISVVRRAQSHCRKKRRGEAVQLQEYRRKVEEPQRRQMGSFVALSTSSDISNVRLDTAEQHRHCRA
ncbi:hypothetical protein KM043_001140 [Ampulex compressa]|nr:hypothetical protein KM043_001140 [Ampulex compressa]